MHGVDIFSYNYFNFEISVKAINFSVAAPCYTLLRPSTISTEVFAGLDI